MIQLQLRISKFFVGFFSWKLSKLLRKIRCLIMENPRESKKREFLTLL